MSVLFKTHDKVLGAPSAEGPQLSFAVGRITAREIVRARVRIEVERYNNEDDRGFVSLFLPAREETELNGPARVRRRTLDADRQVEVALEAVRNGRVIILFNGAQVTDLDADLAVTPVSEARFLRLVPLAGG
jgi:hypothetical protein